jgi:hypothetical protein
VVTCRASAEAEHRPRAHDRRRLAPFGKGRLSGLDGAVDVGAGRQRRAADDGTVRWIMDIKKGGGRRGHPLAADVILQGFNLHDSPRLYDEMC